MVAGRCANLDARPRRSKILVAKHKGETPGVIGGLSKAETRPYARREVIMPARIRAYVRDRPF